MSIESGPRPKVETKVERDKEAVGGAKKWIETIDENGVKVHIGVFGDESDADAVARAKAIDERLDK
ncbi:hypothetical protein KBB27_03115 [Patescibacteria group bacterium]|nr:hypothetical protein [Patescibacteria group bacterium]